MEKNEHVETVSVETFQDAIVLLIRYYFMVTTFSTIGYGDIHPSDIPEYIMGMIFILTGLIIFAYFNSSILSVLEEFFNSARKKEEKVSKDSLPGSDLA